MRRTATVTLFLISLLATEANAQITRVQSTGKHATTPSYVDTLFLQAKPAEALEALSLMMGPADTVTAAQLYNRGLAERINDEGSGLQWFRKAYEADPEVFLVPWSLGTALTDEGLLIEGEGYLREAVKLDKGYFESSVDLGRNLRLQGRHAEAVEALEKAFGRDRCYAPAYTELATTYLSMDKPQQALEILLEGYDRFPYAEILVPLAELYETLDDTANATRITREYLSLYPKGGDRGQMLERLQRFDPQVTDSWPIEYVASHLDNGTPYVDPEVVMPAGLRLDYKVRWGIITIGHLQIDVIEGEYRGESVWEARYIASSLPGIPFVTIADTFYAWIDRDLDHVPLLEMRYDELGYKATKTYLSDYDSGQFREYSRLGNGYWEVASHPLPPHVFDASSQLWIAQQFVMAGLSGKATVELSGGFEKTIINNHGEGPTYKVDGVRTPTIYLDGIMHYSGIAGMTGEFQGLYSHDDRAWPLQAKFKIFLGWVTIDYESYEPSRMTPVFGITR
ncbi:hypothetical protein KQI63_10795 [bacterium]|nr:hypothetical protein [bacterium]